MAEHQGSVGGTLTERPLASYLRDNERFVHTLTNREVGIERTDGDGETQIRPAPDCGAVAALTDQRILLAVGDHSGDFTSGVRYTDVADAGVAVETLTARLVVETATGTTWMFDAREADVEPVDAFLTMACEGWGAVDAVETHCERLAEFLETGEWGTFDERSEAATATLERGRATEAAARIEAVEDRLDRLAGELYELVRDRHVLAGQEALGSAETSLASQSFAASYDSVHEARERFEQAIAVAAAHDVDTGPAAEGLAQAEELLAAVAGRPWAAAREQAEVAADIHDTGERIERLEAAFEGYQTLARLVTEDQREFSGDRAAVREESEAVIESLIDARLAGASERRTAGEWEWEAGNDREAYETFVAARENLERAAELAGAYPPGDAAAIRERQDTLLAQFDPLVISYELAGPEAGADG